MVAEGVELGPQVGALQALGCDELQGYHFARPMPPEAFAHWLNERQGGGKGARRLAVSS